MLLNTDPANDYHVHRGDRIAQLVVQRVDEVEWRVVDDLDGLDRGGGFGHSGPLSPYFQANTGCSKPSTGSSRPSRPSQRNCTSTAPVGAWIRSLPSGTWTTGRSLSGMSMNRGESSRQSWCRPTR